jgi:hypothetical protein
MFRYVVLSKRAARDCTASNTKRCKTPTALIPPTIHLVPIEHSSIAPIRSVVQNLSLSLYRRILQVMSKDDIRYVLSA